METLESLEGQSNSNDLNVEDPSARRKAVLRRLGIGLFALLCFFFFLFMKLPEARIQNLVLAHMRILAQEQGFLFSAEKVKLGVFLGPSVKLYNAELKSIDNEKQSLKIAYLRVRPHLLSLVTSTKKASISAELLEGEVAGTVGAGPTALVANLDIDDINLAATTLIRHFAPVTVTGIIDGSVKLDLDFNEPPKSDGKVELKLKKLNIPAQAVYGFNVPKIAVEDSTIHITIDQGQMLIRTFEVGKDTKTDDLVARVTGEGSLDRMLARSKINAKAVLELSQGVKQSFPILDALLEPAKTADGKYAYRLTGPLMSLEARPGG